ncbi:hypothetical protein BT69DRAFT_58360 [Atractiella rhizophila]|nr:hypothetical protein BT69DRAFT_58360 [Atractiella rhizophila]
MLGEHSEIWIMLILYHGSFVSAHPAIIGRSSFVTRPSETLSDNLADLRPYGQARGSALWNIAKQSLSLALLSNTLTQPTLQNFTLTLSILTIHRNIRLPEAMALIGHVLHISVNQFTSLCRNIKEKEERRKFVLRWFDQIYIRDVSFSERQSKREGSLGEIPCL